MTSTKTNPDNTVIPRPVVLILAVLVFTAFVMMLNETTLAVALPVLFLPPCI